MKDERKTFILGFVSILTSILLLYFIGGLFNKEVPINYLSDIERLFSVNLSAFAPEPLERLLFIFSIVVFPITMVMFYLILDKILSSVSEDKLLIPYYAFYLVSIIIILFLLFNYSIQGGNEFFLENNFIFNFPLTSCILLLVLTSLIYISKKIVIRNRIVEFMDHNKNKINKALYLIVILYIMFVSGTNVYSIYSLDDSVMYTSHLNAVFHSVAVVHMGDSILVDFLNQYGLYPHFLELLFSIIGLSILKFTIVMSILIFLGFFLLYKVLDELIEKKILVVLGFSLVLYFSYLHLKLVIIDSYFQYYPIRTIFPILLVYCSLKYLKNKTTLKYYLFTLLFAVSVLWNLDSGLIVFATWFLVLIFEEVITRRDVSSLIKQGFKHILVLFISLLLVVLFYSLLIYLRSGVAPNILDFMKYQVYFYGYGFYMLPMRLIHPWNLIALVYIIGLLVSFRSVLVKENSLMKKMIFLLSILGVGVSSYYQGRSHNQVLTLVWYPAFMLIAIFTYMLYQKIRSEVYINHRKNWLRIFLFLFLVIFSISSVFSIIKNSKSLYVLIESRMSILVGKKETPLTKGIDFIRKNTVRNEKTLILSYQSGVDYLYSQTTPLIGIPGTSEIFLKKDYDKIYDALGDNFLQKVFIDVNFLGLNQLNYTSNIKVLELLYQNFNIIDRSEGDNVILMERKIVGNKPKNIQENDFLKYYLYDDFYIVDSLTNKPVGIKDNLPPINLSQQFTIETVVKPKSLQKPYAVILGNHPGNGFEGFVIQQDNESGNLYSFSFGDGIEWSIPVSIQLEQDKWNYLAISYDNGTIKVYKNGELNNTYKSNLNHFQNSGMPISVGNWANGDRGFEGIIKGYSISDDIFSDELISKHWELMRER